MQDVSVDLSIRRHLLLSLYLLEIYIRNNNSLQCNCNSFYKYQLPVARNYTSQ
jgi:hypothetical protein